MFVPLAEGISVDVQWTYLKLTMRLLSMWIHNRLLYCISLKHCLAKMVGFLSVHARRVLCKLN